LSASKAASQTVAQNGHIDTDFFKFSIRPSAMAAGWSCPQSNFFYMAKIQNFEVEQHIHFLELALSEAAKCEPISTAFCVGCVLVAQWPSEEAKPVIFASGYSRELPGNTHAEANALEKAKNLSPTELAALFSSAPPPIELADVLTHTDVYTTLEPCSIRASGLSPCADALIAAKVRRCYIGVGEPDDFVNCEGARKLTEVGIEVIWLKGLEQKCLKAARRGHDDT
jgi:pyrimidine deaminase RibD-like protein